MGGFVSNALAGAKQALKNADNFGQRETGNKKAGDKPSYIQARTARRTAAASPAATSAAPSTDNREFMGVRANEGQELNTALAQREQARKALE